jgi:antitoxin component YwqK of YwqJK toxin-antitoxin module
MQKFLSVLIHLLFWATSLGQDTIVTTFNDDSFSNIFFRDYSEDLTPNGLCDYTSRHINAVNGLHLFYDSLNEVVRLKGATLNNVKIGKWSYYDSLGNLRMENVFLNNLDSVAFSSYFDASGKLLKSIESSKTYCHLRLYNEYGLHFFRSESQIGDKTHMTFDSIGKVIYQAEFVKGRLHGKYLSTHDDGTLYSSGYYHHGEKTGKWISSFKGDHSIWCTEEYSKDKLISISFFEQKIMIKNGYVEIIDRYKNGNKRLVGQVKNGIKTGTWYFYDIDGTRLAQFDHDEKGNITTMSGKLDGIPGI